jgi:DNA adenine methylase
MKPYSKSPLRYPGGKSRAISQILEHIPLNLQEYREPFVGGGSVYLAVRSLFRTSLRYTINDINMDVVCFWQCVQKNIELLVAGVTMLRQRFMGNGRGLYQFLKDENNIQSDFDRAVRFFIMNRITFSGVMDAGGYSEQAFEKRFTASSIERLGKIAPLLTQTTITCGDYEPHLFASGDKVFIFLDPPYLSATDSRLYGVRGEFHTSFDHERFAENMRRCSHRWLITYDDSPDIRELFSFAHIVEWELQYGMNNYKQGKAEKGKELFIKNF